MDSKDKKRFKEIGNRINELRNQKGLSYSVLADLSDLDRKTLIDICNKGSNFTILTLMKLTQSLEVSADDILN